MKILILIPVWKRSEVFRAVVKQYQENIYQPEFCFILSQDDPEYSENFKTVIESSLNCVLLHHENLPLADKMNFAIRECYKLSSFDYIMNAGSDDFIALDSIIELYSNYNSEFIGLNSVHVMDKSNGDMYTIDTGNDWQVMGAGRMIHRSIIQRMIETNDYLYTPGFNRGLDGDSQQNILRITGIHPTVLTTDEILVIDVKDDNNINPIHLIKHRLKPYEG